MKYIVIGFGAIFLFAVIAGTGMFLVYNYWWLLLIIAALVGGGIYYMKKQKAEANRV